MARAIWSVRNDWTINSIDPTVNTCRRIFKEELKIVVLLRAKESNKTAMLDWLQAL